MKGLDRHERRVLELMPPVGTPHPGEVWLDSPSEDEIVAAQRLVEQGRAAWIGHTIDNWIMRRTALGDLALRVCPVGET